MLRNAIKLSLLFMFLAPNLTFATVGVEPPPPEDDTPVKKTTKDTSHPDIKKNVDPVVSQAMKLTKQLCKIVMTGDRRGFEHMLHSEAPKDAMRYWWYGSSKAVHFPRLFSKCVFDRVDRRQTTDTRMKIFIKRWVKRVNRFTEAAPVRFKKDPKAKNAWKLISYSL